MRDMSQVKNCRLVGLLDLNQGRDNVKKAILGYLNKLISIGVAGFRCVLGKKMYELVLLGSTQASTCGLRI